MVVRRIVATLLFLSGMLLAVIAVPEVIYQSDRTALHELAKVEQQDREVLFRELLARSKLSQRNLTEDYTFWDDMVRFAQDKLDDQWGAENLNAGIASFHVDGIWVTRPAGTVRYGITATPEGDMVRNETLPIPLDAIRDAVSANKVAEFYRHIGDTTYVVMAAGIVPTADDARITPPQGYFLTLAKVDDSFLRQVGNPSGTTIVLLPPDTSQDPSGLTDETLGTYVFWYALNDERGDRIGVLRIERSSQTMATLASQVSHKRTSNRIAFAALWVLLAVVISLLDRGRVRANVHAEELRKDIEQRTKAEEALQARTKQLERTNKLMVDRELRMVELKREITEKKTSE